MSIVLTTNVRVAGVERTPAEGAISLGESIEAQLVFEKKAVWWFAPVVGSADSVRHLAEHAALGIGSAPADALVAPVQHADITAAISTTAVASVTANGTFRRARIAWNNNGASAAAKLNIAANCANAVHGLQVSQNAKRRDHQMTMGDGVILVCESPITALHFSSDVSITAGTHQLQVTLGN